MADHLEHKGEDVIWQYKPDGLRMMFNSAYAVFGKRAQTLSTTVFESAATQIAQSYGQTFGQTLNPDAILIPAAPRIPPAVFLGQTIALDLKGPWWKGWWNRRRGHDAFAQSFRALIEAETTPLMDQLKTDQTGIIKSALVRSLKAFFADQNAIAASWGTSPDPTAIDPQKTIGPIIQTLQAFLAKPEKASTQ